MSVLINDMEKPKSCYAVIDGEIEYCPFVNTDDDCVLLLKKGTCEGTWEEQYSKCPLVEVKEPCEDAVSRRAAIDTEGLDEEIRCEMCRNPMHTDRGCDGNCKYDEKLYEKIIQILDKRITPLPSAQPEPCDDAVSRADVVDMLEMYPFTEYAEYETAREVVKRLPSVTPKPEPQWIPCSERLPNTNGIYIVTRRISDGFECRNITDACYFDGSNTWHDDTRVLKGD